MPFDNTSLPIRLFTASHERSWNPVDIDFSRERSDWLSFSDDERNLLLRLISGFRVGERGVTHELAPLQFRFRQQGRLEDEMYVTAQLYEEARHVQFFETWLIEALPGRFGVEVPYPDLQGDMFSARLPKTMRTLLTDDSPEALLHAVMLYHFYIEGVGAEASYPMYYRIFEQTGRLPALNQGIRLIQRDEARHIAFGVHVLQRLLAEHPHLVDQFEAQVEAMRPFAEEGPNQTFAGFERGQAPFGLDLDECRQVYIDKLEGMRRSVFERQLAEHQLAAAV